MLRRLRFHYLEWGSPDAPPIVLLHGGHQSAHSWDLVSLYLAQRYRVLALDQRGHGDSEWPRDVEYSNSAMSLDAEAFIETLGLQRPILMGHSMGGRNSLLLTRRNPSRLRALVVVDVGPEVSDRGREVIAGFVQANQEFDDLEHFVANVRKYDPYRSREHIERTVKYNMLQRADGKYVSKCDATPRRLGLVRASGPLENITLDDARAFDLPTLLVRGANSRILTEEARAFPRRAAARHTGDGARSEYERLHRGAGRISGRAWLTRCVVNAGAAVSPQSSQGIPHCHCKAKTMGTCQPLAFRFSCVLP